MIILYFYRLKNKSSYFIISINLISNCFIIDVLVFFIMFFLKLLLLFYFACLFVFVVVFLNKNYFSF